jgi:cytoskeletal protein RodZ
LRVEGDHLVKEDHLALARSGYHTEPPALMTMPDEGVSGLWLWQGAPLDEQNAPPDQQKRQWVPRRGTLWLSIGAALIVAALSTLAAFVLIVPRLPQPATPSASSPATAAIDTPISPLPTVDTPSSPPVADTPAPPPATVDTPASTAAGASAPALAPASVGTPAGMPAEPTARDRAAEPAPSRASPPAPWGVSSQGSRPVAKKAGRSLADLHPTPAFQNGTLRPVPDH